LNGEVLSRLVPKAFEFAKSFLKPPKLALVDLQKWQALCCRLFKRQFIIVNIFGGLKTVKTGPRNMFSNRSEDLSSLVMKSFQKIKMHLTLNSSKLLNLIYK
jgi:hypothetical protein